MSKFNKGDRVRTIRDHTTSDGFELVQTCESMVVGTLGDTVRLDVFENYGTPESGPWFDDDHFVLVAPDSINVPSYYMGADGLEAINVIRAFGLDTSYELAAAAKYILRAGKKPGNSAVQDIKKMKRYLEMWLEVHDA